MSNAPATAATVPHMGHAQTTAYSFLAIELGRTAATAAAKRTAKGYMGSTFESIATAAAMGAPSWALEEMVSDIRRDLEDAAARLINEDATATAADYAAANAAAVADYAAALRHQKEAEKARGLVRRTVSRVVSRALSRVGCLLTALAGGLCGIGSPVNAVEAAAAAIRKGYKAIGGAVAAAMAIGRGTDERNRTAARLWALRRALREAVAAAAIAAAAVAAPKRTRKAA